MEIKAYLKSLGDESAREALALKCETTLGHLRNVSYGLRPPAPELCVLLERESKGAVTRREMRPDDWQRIWPELAELPTPTTEQPA